MEEGVGDGGLSTREQLLEDWDLDVGHCTRIDRSKWTVSILGKLRNADRVRWLELKSCCFTILVSVA